MKDILYFNTLEDIKLIDMMHLSKGHNYSKDYLTFKAIEDCVFTFTMDANLPTTCVPSISYSLDDGQTWATTENVDSQEVIVTTPTIKAGKTVLWKSNAVQYCYQPNAANVGADMPSTDDGAGFSTFKSTGKHNIYGNIMSLLYGDNFIGKNTFKQYVSTGYGAGAFTYLFAWNYTWEEYEDHPEFFNEMIISTKNLILPATTLAPYCYYGMFLACNKMVDCPKLPALNLAPACYKEMFYLCDSLLIPPVLPATTMYTECYREMLDRCRHMLYPPVLPAMVMQDYCYYGMFSCDTFEIAPELPATTVAPHCYHAMFYNMPNLKSGPSILPANTLAESCYEGMLCYCTALVNTPKLPATELATRCYGQMFTNSTALQIAPELPATTLVSQCYSKMFQGCTSLNYVKAMFTTTPSNTYTNSWLSGVASTGTFVKNANAEWTTTGTNAVPTGWTVETSTIN